MLWSYSFLEFLDSKLAIEGSRNDQELLKFLNFMRFVINSFNYSWLGYLGYCILYLFLDSIYLSAFVWAICYTCILYKVDSSLNTTQRALFYFILPLILYFACYFLIEFVSNYISYSVYYYVAKFYYSYIVFSKYDIFQSIAKVVYYLASFRFFFRLQYSDFLNDTIVLLGVLLLLLVFFVLLLVIRGGAPRYRIEQISQFTFNVLIIGSIVFVLIFLILNLFF